MAYSIKYLFKFESAAGTTREIRVLKDGYSGAVIQRPLGRAPMLKKQQNGPVHGTSLEFFAECNVDREFIEFYTSNPKDYRVDLYAGSTLLWQGYITPELYSEPDIAPPYDVQVVATDGVGELKLYDYAAQGTVTLRTLLSGLLSRTGLGTDIYLISSLKPGSAGAGSLLEKTINLDYMAGKTCYDVLTYVLDTLHATITWWKGAWILTRETNVTFTNGKVRYFNTAGNSALLNDSVQVLGKMYANPAWPVGQLSTVIDPAKNKIEVQAPWHPVTCLQNPDMTSDASWTKINSASYDSTNGGYLLPFPQGGTGQIRQQLSMAGLRVPMSISVRATASTSTISGQVVAPQLGVLLIYTVGNASYHLRKGSDGAPVWESGALPSGAIPAGTQVDFQQTLSIWDASRIEAEELKVENIPAFMQGGAFPAGTMTVYIIGYCATVFSAHLDVVLPKGYADILHIGNGARGEGNTVEIAIGRETADNAYYAAFLQGLLLDSGSLITSFSDANFTTGMDYLAFIARDYALSVALPRARVTGTVFLESSVQIPPLVFTKGGLDYWVETWGWNLYEDELEISARTLPSASLTVQSETILESNGSTVSSAGGAGSSGAGSSMGGGGGTNYWEIDGTLNTLLKPKDAYAYVHSKDGLFFSGAALSGTVVPDLYVDTVNNQRVLRSPLPLITGGDQIVIDGTPGGGGGGGGATTLAGLDDTNITNPQAGQMLSWNGTKWVNTNAPTGSITSVSLAAGASNGTLHLVVNGTAQSDVAVTGLKALAYKDSLAASDIPDLSGTYLPLSAGSSNKLSGDLYFSHTGGTRPGYIVWDDGTIRQRIEIHDGYTDVFNFQYSSDSGTSWSTLASISNSGAVTASSFVKSGGTSSQFLKADGSVDSSTYITGINSTMVTNALGYAPVSPTDLSTALSGYLPLTAGASKKLSGDLYFSHISSYQSGYIVWDEGNTRERLEVRDGFSDVFNFQLSTDSGESWATLMSISNAGEVSATSLALSGSLVAATVNTRGVELNPKSNTGDGGYIDFHYNGSSADYTSRLIESASGTMTMIANLVMSSGKTIKIGDATISWNSNGYLHIDKPLVTAGDQIVISGTPGGGGGGGATTLWGLDDVNIPHDSSYPGNGDLLSYDLSTHKWVNVAASSVGGVTSVAGYTGAVTAAQISSAIGLSGYLPLSAGSGSKLSGDLYFSHISGTRPGYIVWDEGSVRERIEILDGQNDVFKFQLSANSGSTYADLVVIGNTGSITASSFVKTNGTSSQFLKADGSVDDRTFLTSHQTLYNLVINNSAGTAQITYKPGTSGTYSLTLTNAMVGLGNVENTALSTWAGTTNITTLGTITSGTWSASTIAVNKGGTGKTSWTQYAVVYASATTTLSQVSNNTTTTRKFLRQVGANNAATAPAWDTVTKTDVGLSNVENTALSTWAGTTNITTLGTITSGTWNGSAIAWSKLSISAQNLYDTIGSTTYAAYHAAGYVQKDGDTMTGALTPASAQSGVAWACSTLTASGSVSASSFNGNYLVASNVMYIGAASSALGTSYTGGCFYAYGNNPLYFYTNSTSRMIITGGGNVGIGTASPGYNLDVNGVIRGSIMRCWNTDYTGNAGYIGRGGSTSNDIQLYAESAGVTISTGGTERMRVTSSGDVGIGTTSPSYRLDVNGSVGCTTLAASGNATITGSVSIGNAGNAALFLQRATWNYIVVPSGANLGFNVGTDGLNASTKMVLYNGNIGIGTYYPGFNFHNTGVTATTELYFLHPSATNEARGKISYMNGTYGWGMYLDSTYNQATYAAQQIVLVATNGGVRVVGTLTSSGDQVVSSDATLKTNLTPVTYSVSDIAKARAVEFDWRDGRGHSMGSIAQDWLGIAPALVHGEEGNMSLAYGQLALVNTIIEAREIETLKARVAELEAEVKRLRMN